MCSYGLSVFVFAYIVSPVVSVSSANDSGYHILRYMQQYEGNLAEPIDMDEQIICNCSHVGCDAEIVRFLGAEHAHQCRSTSGMCYKSLVPDGDVVLACLSREAVPDLFCAVKQPMKDGSVMQCCRNQSFCNGALELKLPESKMSKGLPISIFLICSIGSGAVLLVIVFVIAFAWINKPLKKWLFYWIFRRPIGDDVNEAATEELLLNSPSDPLGHLSHLLCNLDDTNTTGSGSGLPLLVQRTIARQIELSIEIGKGRFGEVWLGYWRGDAVAVKIFSSRDERSWSREVEIYQTNLFRHPNVLRFIASDNKDTGTSTQLWLITEYHEFGSLSDYLSENTVDCKVMLQMIRSIANGLAFLHTEIPGMRSKPAIAHRDLKSKNILIKSDLTCVIADLGLAVRYLNGQINLPDNNKCGTIRYLAPEVLSDLFSVDYFEAYKTADMYSFGLIIWEIASRCIINECVDSYVLPYFECVGRDPSVDEMKVCVAVEKRRPPIKKQWINDNEMNDVVRIMHECWAESPLCRLTALNVRIAIDRHAKKLDLKLHT